ncbi:MAG: phosphoribosylformylglycinamidine synthase [Oscillospiraceae bacterium]
MVYRVYVSKKEGYNNEDKSVQSDLRTNLGIDSVKKVKIYNRYDVENIDKDVFDRCVNSIFSEMQVDDVAKSIKLTDRTFATELLPGQFDQRADSAEQCVQFVTSGTRPTVKYARVIKLTGDISDAEYEKIKEYLVNPVESRLASLDKPETLDTVQPTPEKTPILKGFTAMSQKDFDGFIEEYSLAMDGDDLAFCIDYFKNTEKRDPTLTELKMIDTYWSDHCRHTTFMTQLTDIVIEDENVKESWDRYLEVKNELYPQGNRPVTLMDLATIGAKYLKRTGKLKNLDESEEINACSVKIDVTIDGEKEKWLLMFKNETHNHPTEIEPFGGAATCLGGAIRDPLSGRSYVYQAMRLTGAADPTVAVSQTIKGKLPQIKICRSAAAGYASYGNQIGLAAGHIAEIYHPGFVAKRLECGAVVGAVRAKSVVRHEPKCGDVVILLGGATGRDGCGGATGSSKAHDVSSISTCGAQVQKGNAPEERKIQRLFRDGEVTKMIKRCNDFGAGGVSVAIGELADSLLIDLDVVPKKYDGLTGTELAISESQERMAVVVSARNAAKFIKAAEKENLSAVLVAKVTDSGRLEMVCEGDKIVSLQRTFLNSAGAAKHCTASIEKQNLAPQAFEGDVYERWEEMISSLNVCSQRGLVERFDSTVGGGTVLMPFGGKRQLTPSQAMAAVINSEKGEVKTASIMAYGFDPYLAQQSPYYGAYYGVVSSVAKLVAAGGDMQKAWFSFQEYFEKLGKDPTRWGKPLAALLGAFQAQLDFGIGAIGGKDSMSGSFEDISVPPSLISFVCGVSETDNIISTEFKKTNSNIYFIQPQKDANGLYNKDSLVKTYKALEKAIKEKRILAAWAVGMGGVAEAVTKMSFGNQIGVKLDSKLTPEELFCKNYGAFVVETDGILRFGKKIGVTTEKYAIIYNRKHLKPEKLEKLWEGKLEGVYPTKTPLQSAAKIENIQYNFDGKRPSPIIKTAAPRVLIPVFPGTNCEYDVARAFERAGAKTEIFVVKNRKPSEVLESAKALAQLIKGANIVALPGGFSGGDEPDGSAKFIISLLRNPMVAAEIQELLEARDGLMCGICNGFQALVKLGLVPYGKIVEPSVEIPTLTFNSIARHQSRLTHFRVASNKSPWLMHYNVNDCATAATSHGEGRFIASPEVLKSMIENGQIATQYVDLSGNATSDILFNPNNSALAIEGITSPDGRVFGKMCHDERWSKENYKNVPNSKALDIFKGAVDYFK